MDLRQFVRRLTVPDGATVPTELARGGVLARALTRADLADDVAGINASLELILQTRGGAWPTGPVTEEHNYVDLVWHECEFRDGGSYTYVLRDAAGGYLGCCYLYPMGGRTKLTEELLDHDVDVSWWVTPNAYELGFYPRVHAALKHWLATDLPFRTPFFSNRKMP
ncbi:GNAT family N-acetyltransferase [Allokutzneria sp. NRRL B-24872]|uniref:GNAT family N-acetyltransferase n=1 Tax=Allokutzneria sp. NRRL B-24872 TaxID=1137961 RepID=UPI000A39E2F8|nr:GNAT family N-acetyltransferase [Allokutzneria sp. NRRL B-24872]